MGAGMTFREAARQLRTCASEARGVATRLEADHGEDGWAIARDVHSLAWSLERYADVAERTAENAGEPTAEDTAWIATAAPGEITEVYGR